MNLPCSRSPAAIAPAGPGLTLDGGLFSLYWSFAHRSGDQRDNLRHRLFDIIELLRLLELDNRPQVHIFGVAALEVLDLAGREDVRISMIEICKLEKVSIPDWEFLCCCIRHCVFRSYVLGFKCGARLSSLVRAPHPAAAGSPTSSSAPTDARSWAASLPAA